MNKFLILLFSLITAFSQFFGLAGDSDYERMTNLKESLKILFNKNEVISQQHTGTVSEEKWSADEVFSFENTAMLKKEKGKDFKILTLSDIHFSDFGYRAFLSIFNVNKIKRLVATNQPDLILLLGDIVCGDNSDYYSIQRITDLMESFGIPWAPVFGNHDDEVNCDLNFLADVMMQSPHCLMQKGDPEMGVGNYIINVAEDDKIVESLIMMDSHHNQPNEKQHEWFKWATDGINRLTDNGSEISVYMHIPIPEYRYAYDEAWNADTKKWNKEYNAYGSLHESVACERDGEGNPVQRGFFDLVKASGTTKYIFCGHDHMNDFSIEYDGIRLTYMMKLGMASGFQVGFDGGSIITVGSTGIKRITHKTLSFGPLVKIVDIDISKNKIFCNF